MFSSLARSRALALSLFLSTVAPRVYATQDILFTSSVTYCNPPETLLIQRFEVAYFPSNNSVSFNVSAASVQSNVNVTANLFVNVYGMQPINMTLDLCGILGGALCPLPMYNFTGADSITLPSSINVAKSVPGIAYVVPDLEGFAQLSLNEIKTGDLKACVQATLSNGRSAHQPAVEWTTGGVTLAALLVGIWQSILSPQALLPFRLLELVTLYQTIASSSFLDLNYPSVYRAFAINFSWALGLISASSVQNSINRMRHLTGGNLEDATGASAVGLVNRKLSPYNEQLTSAYANEIGYGSILSRSLPTNLAAIIHPNLATYFSPSIRDTIVNGDVQTVTAASSNVLQAGVPIYVNTLHIATANAFVTVFLCTLCVIAVALATFTLGYGIIAVAKRVDERKRTKLSSTVANFDYRSFVISWCLRTGLVVFFPLLIFIFYQWSLKDSWLSILISVISFLAIMALLGYPLFRVFRTARAESSYALYEENSEFLLRHGPLHAQHRPERYYFSALLIGAFLLRAIFIAAAQSSGEAQLALFIITELTLVVAQIWLKPAATRGGDVLGSYLAILRLVCTGLMIAFLERLAVKAIPRVVIGIVIAIAWSVAVLVVIGSIAWQTVDAVIRSVRGFRSSTSDLPARSEASMLEKGARGMPMGNGNGSTRSNLMGARASVHSASADSERSSMRGTDAASSLAAVARARPVNPTPEDNDRVPLDAYALYAAYPISPTGTTVSTAEPPSLYSRDSGTLTVGSLLPRRWSFGLSQPGSPAASSDEHRRSSLTPPSPSEASSYGSSSISRTASARAPVHQPTHPDIEEEEVLPPSLSPRPPPS